MDENFQFIEYPDQQSAFNYDWIPNYRHLEFPNIEGIPKPVEPKSDRLTPLNAVNSTNTVNPGNLKVAIPRHAPPSNPTSSGRVSQACENCREQKAKCTGHRPVCHRCRDSGAHCSYGDRKKEKMVKQLNDLTSQVESLENLLCDLYPKLEASTAHQVDQRLKDLNLRSPLSHSNSSSIPAQSTVLPHGFTSMFIPPGGANYSEEDLNRGDKVQGMGFVGEHSEMAWLYRLKRELDHDSSSRIKEIPGRPVISSVNYFQDDSEFSVADDVDLARCPPQHIANRLVGNYFHTVHSAFPIIAKAIFLNQYRYFYSNPNPRPGKRWLAVLNLVFAIATRHALLTDHPQTDHDEHHVYFARAWKLSMRNVLVDHPNLQQTQVEGMAAFYLLSVGQVNRSWRIVGIAIRSAITMGLNLRSETENITHFSKELRYRVWWALFMLDTLLCEITGRPLTMGHTFCTTPLPSPSAEEGLWDERAAQSVTNEGTRSTFFTSLPSDTTFFTSLQSDATEIPSSGILTRKNSGHQPSNGKQPAEQPDQAGTEIITPNAYLYFLYRVDLTHLLRKAIEILYAPGSARQPWHEIESAISTLNNQADNWLSRLPVEFQLKAPDRTRQSVRQRIGLACRFYATKLIILQPSIRRLFHKSSEPSTSGTVHEKLADICVQVAGQMIDLLPKEVDTAWIHGVAPWWCILHNIMQATSILLTELLTRTAPGTTKAVDLTAKITKSIQWLHKMSTNDPSSLRAWIVCTEILSRHGSRFGVDWSGDKVDIYSAT